MSGSGSSPAATGATSNSTTSPGSTPADFRNFASTFNQCPPLQESQRVSDGAAAVEAMGGLLRPFVVARVDYQEAAREGMGVVLLPELTCAEAIRRGELEVVLPQWNLPQGICHAIYPSRRGLLPAVRVFIDYLAERLPPMIEAARLQCSETKPRKP